MVLAKYISFWLPIGGVNFFFARHVCQQIYLCSCMRNTAAAVRMAPIRYMFDKYSVTFKDSVVPRYVRCAGIHILEEHFSAGTKPC